MLHIFLVILKITGILIAVLLGIVVILVLGLLFFPLCYKIEGSYRQALEIRGRASFLGPVLRLYLCYGGELEYKLRVFGIPILRSSKTEAEVKPHKHTSSREDVSQEEQEKKEPVLIDFDRLEEQEKEAEPEWKEEVHQEQKKNSSDPWLETIRYQWKQLQKKIKNGLSLWNRVRNAKDDERVRTGVGRLKEEVFLLLGKIRPRKLKGYMRVGFDNPADTGKFLGLMAVLRSLWNTRISIQPDFEMRIFETELVCSGFIQGFRFVRLGWKYFFDKEIQYAVRKGKNIRRK